MVGVCETMCHPSNIPCSNIDLRATLSVDWIEPYLPRVEKRVWSSDLYLCHVVICFWPEKHGEFSSCRRVRVNLPQPARWSLQSLFRPPLSVNTLNEFDVRLLGAFRPSVFDHFAPCIELPTLLTFELLAHRHRLVASKALPHVDHTTFALAISFL